MKRRSLQNGKKGLAWLLACAMLLNGSVVTAEGIVISETAVSDGIVAAEGISISETAASDGIVTADSVAISGTAASDGVVTADSIVISEAASPDSDGTEIEVKEINGDGAAFATPDGLMDGEASDEEDWILSLETEAQATDGQPSEEETETKAPDGQSLETEMDVQIADVQIEDAQPDNLPGQDEPELPLGDDLAGGGGAYTLSARKDALTEEAMSADAGTLQDLINRAVGEEPVEPVELTLSDDYQENIVIPDGAEVVLNLGGHTLTAEDMGTGARTESAVSVFGTLVLTGEGTIQGSGSANMRGVSVAAGARFTLAGGTITGFRVNQNGAGNGGGVFVEPRGSFAMEGGRIEGNTASGNGGGVYLYDAAPLSGSGVEVVLRGGSIAGNTAGGNGGGLAAYQVSAEEFSLAGDIVISGNTASGNGGGFYLRGAASGVTLASGVQDNEAGGSGGGLYFEGGKPDCRIGEGAKISGNRAGVHGGGLWLPAGAALTMTGGSVHGNSLHGPSTHYGGGVCIGSNTADGSSFTMTGGSVTGNYLDRSDVGTYTEMNGGGIFVSRSASLKIGGTARIAENYGFSCGGGIYVCGTLRSFVIEGGEIRDNRTDRGGAGVYAGGALTMTGGTVSGNRSEGKETCYGGGISASGAFTMTGGTVSGNSILLGYGGGVNCGSAVLSGEAKITDNTAQYHGGGVYGGSITVRDQAEISGNCSNNYGGGIKGTAVTIEGGVLRDNEGSVGGAVYADASFAMTDGIVEGNFSTSGGGGIYVYNSDAVISGGRIAKNEAKGYGGGVCVEHNTYIYKGVLTVSGAVEIEGNRAGGNGGGIYCDRYADITGGSIHGNTAVRGGGIAMSGYTREGRTDENYCTVVGGLLYDNTATTAKGGNDLYQAGKNDKDTESKTFPSPRLQLAAASDFVNAGRWTGRGWYEEISGAGYTEAVEETIEWGQPRAYTFYYSSGQAVAQFGGETYLSVQAAVDALRDAGASGGAADSRCITLISDSWENVTVPAGVTAELDLAGYTLKGFYGSVLFVDEGADLTIVDSSAQSGGEGTGRITGGSGTPNPRRLSGELSGGGLFVLGTATLESGHICGNAASWGGGVYVGGEGSFTLKGGFIEENTRNGVCVNYEENAKREDGSAYPVGGRFLMTGGVIRGNQQSGVRIYTKGSFRMEGGEIIQNESIMPDGSGEQGGGVYLSWCAEAVMTGGRIADNTANSGGGVYVGTGDFTFLGGEICGNLARGNGGGVSQGYGRFKMPKESTGIITGNAAGRPGIDKDGLEGGGIYANAQGAPLLEGGKLYGNSCTGRGQDICLESGRVYEVMLELFAAEENMAQEGYVAWYDAVGGRYIKGGLRYELPDNSDRRPLCCLTAVKYINEESVARVGDAYFSSLCDAVGYVRQQRAAGTVSEEELTIFLVKDGYAESVMLQEGDQVTVDLNGRTLKTEHMNIFHISGGSLTLTDSSRTGAPQKDAKTDGAGGLLTPMDGNTTGRAVYMTGGSLETNNVTFSGFGSRELTIQGGGAIYAQRGCSVTLGEGTVLTGNCAQNGGAVMLTNVGSGEWKFKLDHATVTDNFAKNGGGIYLKTADAAEPGDGGEETVVLTDSRISRNTASVQGGGIWAKGWDNADNRRRAVLTRMEISENTAEGTNNATGGALIHCFRTLTVTDTEVIGNTSQNGMGGVWLGCAVSAAEKMTELHIQNMTVSRNRAFGGYYGGGAICGFGTMENCRIEGNRADTRACYYGGLFFSGANQGGTLHVKDTDFVGNYSWNGGAAGAGEKVNLTIEGGEITGNSSASGGIVYIGGNLGDIVLDGVKLCGNSGNGINGWTFENLYLKNTEIGENTGRGILVSSGRTDVASSMYVQEGTRIHHNAGGIYTDYTVLYIEGGEISGNTASEGGGVYLYNGSALRMTGGRIVGNTANYGGGVYTRATNSYTNPNKAAIVPEREDMISGGEISGNTAQYHGGGIYIANSWTRVHMSGGAVCENAAKSRGGGVYINNEGTGFELKDKGKLCDNRAGLGQDIYAYCGTSVVDAELHLTAPREMFAAEDGCTGIGWYDEMRDEATGEEIHYAPVKNNYALTLQYERTDAVARILRKDGTYDGFASVQAAVAAAEKDALSAGEGGDRVYAPCPEIILVKNASGNVRVPGGVNAVLNLNGYTLRGDTTALTVYGTLRIVDEDAAADEPDPEIRRLLAHGVGIGTITGTAPTNGGGMIVNSGASVTMESGQISGCHAAATVSGNQYGGAGVFIDGGVFTLAGTASINHCDCAYGSAVYLSPGAGSFVMKGGRIEKNTVSSYGVVNICGGTFRMSGGAIAENEGVSYGGGLWQRGGRSYLTGGRITGNTAGSSAGIYMTGGTMYMDGVEITGNSTTGKFSSNLLVGAGGGLGISGGTVYIDGATRFADNTAARGGGIYQWGGTIRMQGGAVTENRAELGGGVAQSPTASSIFELSGGQLCGNVSTLSGLGNDFYSHYEGTGTYNPGAFPKATLLPAAEMGNPDYNAWKDDDYAGEIRVAKEILKGQYVTGQINQSRNLQLTADRYGDEASDGATTALRVQTFRWDKDKGNGSGVLDGAGSFDITAKDSERYTQGKEKTGTDGWNNGRPVQEEAPGEADPGSEGEDTGESEELTNQAESWRAGMDSGNNNGIIRTYDSITYYLKTTVGFEEDPDGGEEPEKVRLFLEISVPGSSDEMEISLGNEFQSQVLREREEADGRFTQVMTAYREIEGAAGTVESTVMLTVKAMKNGDMIRPVFRQWIGGNPKDKEEPATLTGPTETVSASGKYNLTLLRNTELAYTGYFDLSRGVEVSEKDAKGGDGSLKENIVYGTMLGYGLTLSMQNDRSYALKGLQLPSGPVSFDLHLSGELYLDGEPISDGARQAPYIWAYKENMNTPRGTDLSGTSSSFCMDWNDEDDKNKSTQYAYDAAPFNTGNNGSSCYAGGVWRASGSQPQEDDTQTDMRFTVSGYTVDPGNNSNPYYCSSGASNAAFNTDAARPFSAGYLQVLFPIHPDVMKGRTGYLEIRMQGLVSDLEIRDSSGAEPRQRAYDDKDSDFGAMIQWFGDSFSPGTGYRGHARNEIKYMDNYTAFTTGLYVYGAGGEKDYLDKVNFFNSGSNGGTIGGSNGNGVTPIGSVIHIGATVSYSSERIDTTKAGNNSDRTTGMDRHIGEEDFDGQVDNYIEYNYLTAFNLLQKFDADAYTPYTTVGKDGKPVFAPEVVRAISKGDSGGKNYADGAFRVNLTEDATTWSETQTRSYELTILYAAKPDGSNWVKSDTPGNLGGEQDMEQYREENLLYFRTLGELYDYFGYNETGEPVGKCVAFLYEFRDCCIRRGRNISVYSKMNVTNDFARTGKTYCTTNDVKAWSTYRPFYKATLKGVVAADRNDPSVTYTRDDLLYHFNWVDIEKATDNGVTAYGAAFAAGTRLAKPDEISGGGATVDGYYDVNAKGWVKRPAEEMYSSNYRKREYKYGSPEGGTHTGGWREGNALLLYTLDSSIRISVDDTIEGSAGTPRENYRVSGGERTANFRIRPEVRKDSSVLNALVDSATQQTEIKIVLTIPNHLHYNEASIRYDYAGSGYQSGDLDWDVKIEKQKGPDGSETTVIEFSAFVTDLNKKLPQITYSCTIGAVGVASGTAAEKDVRDGETLTTKVTLWTTYAETGNLAENAKSDEVTIRAVRTGLDNIWIEKDSRVELGRDLVYTLHYKNSSDDSSVELPQTRSIQLADVLPYNGDGRGTEFSGSYRVKALRVRFTDEEDCRAFMGGTGAAQQGELKYFAGETVPKNEPEAMNPVMERFAAAAAGTALTPERTSGLQGGWWTVEYELPELSQDAADASGWALYGRFPQVTGNKEVKVELVLSARDGGSLLRDTKGRVQQGGNRYWDSFFYCSSSDCVASNRVVAEVVERSLEGLAWLDQNHDGRYLAGTASYPSSDRLLQGVDVYLYTDREPELPEDLKGLPGTTGITHDQGDPDDRSDDTWTQGGITLGALTVGEKTYYPAVDILGSLVKKAATGSGGSYSFGKLQAGRYFVAFADDGGDYAVVRPMAAAHPLGFERLSVTLLEKGVAGSIRANRAQPDYSGAKDSAEDGAAPLARAFIDNGGAGIALRGLEDIDDSSVDRSQNWNCGLYYLELTLEKQWANIYDPIQAGTAVAFTVEASLGGGAVQYGTTYHIKATAEMTAGNARAADVEATKDNSLADTQDGASPGAVLPGLAAASSAAEATVTWTLGRRALQAEGALGPIAYTVRESSATEPGKDGDTPLVGYRMKGENLVDGATLARTFRAVNTRILFTLDLTKAGVGAGGEPAGEQKLAGAQFTLYQGSDPGSGAEAPGGKIRELVTGADGKLRMERLTKGMYYLRETKAPAGYRLSNALYRIVIAYDALALGSEEIPAAGQRVKPTVEIWQVTDDRGDSLRTEEHPEGVPLGKAAGGMAGAPAKPGVGEYCVGPDEGTVTEATAYEDIPVQYEISLYFEDESIYTLPMAGGIGITWNTLAGIGLMLAAVWLTERRRRTELIRAEGGRAG